MNIRMIRPKVPGVKNVVKSNLPVTPLRPSRSKAQYEMMQNMIDEVDRPIFRNQPRKGQSGNFTTSASGIKGASQSDINRMNMHDAKIQSRRDIADGSLKSGNFTNSASGRKDISQSDFIKMQQKQANRQQMHEKGKKIGAGIGLGAAGLYATTDLMNRYRNGGNLGRNSQGEKDIVGIPFF